MNKPLWQIIKEIEEKKGISAAYIHYNWGDGEMELNIEFNNDIADGILEKSEIPKKEQSAYWE